MNNVMDAAVVFAKELPVWMPAEERRRKVAEFIRNQREEFREVAQGGCWGGR